MDAKSNLVRVLRQRMKELNKERKPANAELDLEELGKRIGMVDRHIVALLSERIERLALQVVRYKKAHNEPIIRFNVEEKRLAAVRALAQEKGLDQNFIGAIFYMIIAEMCRVQIGQWQTESNAGKLSPEALKRNLLILTQEIAPLYNEQYGSDQFATSLYLKKEDEVLGQEIGTLRILGNTKLAVDLGCATGRKTFQLAEHFDRVVGYDISPAMIGQAQANLKKSQTANVEFVIADMEKGLPEADNSVSLAVMNLGTASDVQDIKRVLASIKRALKPDGRFLLSFYNASALLYNCWFVPWPVSLAARIDTLNHCLEVRLKNRTFLIPARAYTKREVELLLRKDGLTISQILTYPTISSILPNEFFENVRMQQQIGEIDARLTKMDTGAYILVTGRKK